MNIAALFSEYTIQSAAPANTINLEVPLAPLQRALRAALPAASATIRLTKKGDTPYLCVALVHTATVRNEMFDLAGLQHGMSRHEEELADQPAFRADRETAVELTIPIRVIPATQVAGLYEPRCREPDVHIHLPPLAQLKAVSDRFTKLAASTPTSTASRGNKARGPTLELAATAHGSLRLRLQTDASNIASTWRGLMMAELDPNSVAGGADAIAQHPSTLMKQRSEDSEDGWATVRIDGKDWGRVLSVGRLGGRVIACFISGRALVLYVYLEGEDGAGIGEAEGGCLTYYVGSYAA